VKKDLNYYIRLSYPIELYMIPDDEGGGYSASIPQLGKLAFRGDGETVQEALDNLNSLKVDLFTSYLERGIPIPEPTEDIEQDYSGRFVVRIPTELHRSLAIRADANKTSLNQYVQFLLTSSWVTDGFEAAMEKCSNKFNNLIEEMRTIEYNIEGATTGYNRRQKLRMIYNPESGKAA
jgi:antitoxin HicB